jgi:hypothetical protein
MVGSGGKQNCCSDKSLCAALISTVHNSILSQKKEKNIFYNSLNSTLANLNTE